MELAITRQFLTVKSYLVPDNNIKNKQEIKLSFHKPINVLFLLMKIILIIHKLYEYDILESSAFSVSNYSYIVRLQQLLYVLYQYFI